MTSITNKTHLPLTVPLPGGKKLRLGPGKNGQINPKAVEFPAVQKLLDEGEIELGDDGPKRGSGGSGGKIGKGRDNPTGGIRRVGDG